ALSSSSASSARCFGPPVRTGSPSTRTVSGPRIRNSRRLAPAIARGPVCSTCRPIPRGEPDWDKPGIPLADDQGVLYTAKCFWPGVTDSDLRVAAARAGGTTGERPPQARFQGALYLPGDELVLCLFESSSPGSVKRASELAGMPCE